MDVFPAELSGLFGKINKRTGDGRIPFKESLIIASVSQNCSDVADVLGSGPFANRVCFGYVHLYLAVAYNHS